MIQLLEVLDLNVKLFEYQPRKKAAPAHATVKTKGSKGGSTKSNQNNQDNKERLKSLENAIMNPTAARDMLKRRREMELRAGMIYL